MLYERIITAAIATPWAIEPTKLRVIESFLARKARGETIPEDEIQAARQQRHGPAGRVMIEMPLSEHEILAAKELRKSQSPTPGGVGVVPIYGTITQRADVFSEWSGGTSTEKVGQQIDALAADPNVKAIVLDVDSPGGSVYGVAGLADKIRETAKTKKVIGVANSEAASAAYWLISQCSEVVVDPSGQVGSIGVYVMHVDRSEAMRQSGLRVNYISAGERKVAGNPHSPLDELGREELQASVNDYYGMFVGAVAKGRGRQQSTVRNGFGKGGMLRAQEAVSEGMADKVGTLEEVLNRYGASAGAVSPAASRSSGYASRDNSDVGRRWAQLADDVVGAPAPAADRHAIEVRKRRMLLDRPGSAAAVGPSAAASSPVAVADPADDRIAHHEAGHAVVAWLLGDRRFRVEIGTEGRSAGRFMYGAPGLQGFDRATVAFAGGFAESLSAAPPLAWYSGDRDEDNAHAACPDQGRRTDARREAARLVAAHRRAIKLVAEQLVTRRALWAEDVGRILSS